MVKFKKFDAAEYLKTEAEIAEFLSVCLEMEDPRVFISALATAARARGMSQLAQETDLGRESLYKTLAPPTKPRFETVLKITRALGFNFSITPRPPLGEDNSAGFESSRDSAADAVTVGG